MLIDENMNLNTLVMYKSENNEPEYKKWLLNETKKEETVEKAQQRRDSFDFDDMSDGKALSRCSRACFISFFI